MKRLLKSIMVLATLAMVTLGMATVASAMEAKVNVPEGVLYGDAPVARSYTYTQNDQVDDYATGVIIPISVPKAGTVFINATSCTTEESGFFAVFKDQQCTNANSTNLFTSYKVGDKTLTEYFTAPKAGTYYLKIWSYNINEEAFTNRFNLTFQVVTTAEKTVKSGQIYRLASPTYNSEKYFKFKATATGIIYVQTGNSFAPAVTFLNSKKKAISTKRFLSSNDDYTMIYAVKKGQTYFIKVSDMSSGKLNLFSITQKKVKEKSGSKRKKAVTLKKKKKVYGTMQIGEKADWYKFKVTKKKAVKITVATAEANYLRISVYDSKGKRIGSKQLLSTGTNAFKVTYGSTFGKANKGTYYIKVERDSKKSCGYYRLSWK